MQIYDYNYRKPKYLKSLEINPNKIDTIGLHNTGNNNNINANTDYHIDSNKWAWLGYGYYIAKGKIYRIRGSKYQNAGIKGHNNHTVNIAIEGNYNKDYISEEDGKALEWLIMYLKKENDNIKHVKGHNFFNNTICPGKNFNIEYFEQFLYKKEINYDTIIDELRKQVKTCEIEIKRLERIVIKSRKMYYKLKEIYEDNLRNS